MQTMNLRSKTALVLSSAIAGLLTATLTAITGTGMAGIYGFGFVGLLALCTFLAWPEIRRGSSQRSSAQSQSKT